MNKQKTDERKNIMYTPIFPAKLQRGDTVAVIAPSRSFSILSESSIEIANRRFQELGLQVVFGKHIHEMDAFGSSSIEHRIADLHWAFADPSVKAIFTAIGGFNSNQLLSYIDWQLIKKNPKILCGYSDITALNNAIFAQTGVVNYSGPHYSSFGQLLNFDYTLNFMQQCLFKDAPISIQSSAAWSDDAWYFDQQTCNLMPNHGMYTIVQGQTRGTIVGGNLVTLRNLQGTPYFPSLQDIILFLEDDYESQPHHFDSALQALCLLPDFTKVKGLVIGRFQQASGMSQELLHAIIMSKKELRSIPVIAAVDFGHTSPMITFPIGGQVMIKAETDNVEIVITKH